MMTLEICMILLDYYFLRYPHPFSNEIDRFLNYGMLQADVYRCRATLYLDVFPWLVLQ